MPKIAYGDKRVSDKRRALIERANAIIVEYQEAGYQLTVRQLFYQHVARGLIENTPKSYGDICALVNDGRQAGLIDWDAIVDRTRNLASVPHWSDPQQILRDDAEQFRIDKWRDQRYRPEVWIEKDALTGVIEGICTELDVAHFACRGYVSQSEMWRAAMRLDYYRRRGQIPVILHFGDHDPSGRDMTRDIVDRLSLFGTRPTKVDRLALNMDQVDQYQPPPNPAKLSDARAQAYIVEFGDESWELDALDPAVLNTLVRDAVAGLRDDDKWEAAVDEENEHRERLARASERWADLNDHLDTLDEE